MAALLSAVRRPLGALPLRTRLIGAFVALTFIPLLVGGGIGFQRLRAAQQNDALLRIEALASNQATRLSAVYSEQLRLIDTVSEDPQLLARTADANDLRDVIERYGNGLVGIATFGRDESIVLLSDSSMVGRLDDISFPTVSDPILGGRVRVRSGRPVHQIITAHTVDGDLDGWFALEFEVDQIGDVIGDYSALGATGETLIIEQSEATGAQLLFSARGSGELADWDGEVGSSTPVAQAANGREGSLVGVLDYRGVTVIATSRNLDDLGWGVVVKQDLDEALRATEDFRLALLVSLGLGVGLIAAIGWWVGLRVTRPLADLRDVANAVAGGDLSKRALVLNDDEIGELSRSFNIMTNELVRNAEQETQRTSDLELTNRRLSRTESRTRTILETAAEGIVETDRLGIVTGVNTAAEQIFGRPSRQLIGESINEFIAAPPQGVIGHVFVAAESVDGHGLEVSVQRPDGSEIPALLAVSRIAIDSDVAYTGLLRDISERVAFEQELEHQATHDALTGLPNRTVLTSELELALVRSAETLSPIALYFLDLDRFKQVNDTLGHQAGDELLRQVVSRARNALRPSDLLSRFGGDEFVVLTDGIRGEQDALVVGERIRQALDEPFVIDGEEVFTSVSIGIVVASGGDDISAEVLLGDADNAMYRAKDTGRNKVELFDIRMREEIVESHGLDMALRKATGNDELRFAYQPVVDANTGEVSFVEALARWDRPGFGPVAPDQFIEMAEQSGLIRTLGPKLLIMAVEQLKIWNSDHTASPVAMSVNVSSQQLSGQDFIPQLRDLLNGSGIDPSTLILELTETAVVRDLAVVRNNLEAARNLGVVVAIDDFGSGYSSLSYLKELPLDILKLDRMFVNEVGEATDSSIIDLVVSMSKTLGFLVVAEGVETAAQFETLRALGLDQIQGYCVSRPLPPDELEKLIWDGAAKRLLMPEGVSAGV